MQPFLRGFLVLQELTPSCIQKKWRRSLGSAALLQPYRSDYKAVAETKTCLYMGGKTVCSGWTPNSVFAALQWKFSFLFGENSHYLGRSHNPGIIFIAEIKWYQSHSKSCPVVSEARGEADRVPCHQMVYFCILGCFCWRSAANFICREGQNQFNTANTLVEPAHITVNPVV